MTRRRLRRIAVTVALAVGGTVACGSGRTADWTVTVYYTAVEAVHHGPPRAVRGCPVLECTHGDTPLGSYPADFVQAVQDEGAGRIGEGRYLNWSSDTGYWLDSAPRDTKGRPLEPFVSAAADGLADGTHVRLAGCGRLDDGTAVPAAVCHRLSTPDWQIRDAFTPGLGGRNHLDLYIGQETGPGFTEQPEYVTLIGAVVTVGR